MYAIRSYYVQGTVSNTEKGVIIRAVGEDDRLKLFQGAITGEAPPLATISAISSTAVEFELAEPGFTIIASTSTGNAATSIRNNFV